MSSTSSAASADSVSDLSEPDPLTRERDAARAVSEHCDYPDCEQHNSYLLKLAVDAMKQEHAQFQSGCPQCEALRVICGEPDTCTPEQPCAWDKRHRDTHADLGILSTELPGIDRAEDPPLTLDATPSTGQGNTSWGHAVKASGDSCMRYGCKTDVHGRTHHDPHCIAAIHR